MSLRHKKNIIDDVKKKISKVHTYTYIYLLLGVIWKTEYKVQEVTLTPHLSIYIDFGALYRENTLCPKHSIIILPLLSVCPPTLFVSNIDSAAL